MAMGDQSESRWAIYSSHSNWRATEQHLADHSGNYRGTIDSSYKLKSPGISVDALLEQYVGLSVPTHIKMDIDGIQDKVIRGAADISLWWPKICLLELNPRDTPENINAYDFIINEMSAAGFALDKIVHLTQWN